MMRRLGFGLITAIIMANIMAVLLLVGCSVYDDYLGQNQALFRVDVVDSNGVAVPQSNVTRAPLYCFVNGFFSRMLTPEPDGSYRYVFGEHDSVTLVSVAGKAPSEYTLKTPRVGEAISNMWLQLNNRGAEGINPYPSPVFYGQWSGTGADVKKNETIPITLRDVRGKVRVLIRGLKEKYGDGSYRVVIDGVRGGLAYDGSTTSGPSLSYELEGAFRPGTGDWLTEPVVTLPSLGSEVSVRIYKKDGALLFNRDTDDDGNKLIVKSRSDDVIVFTASDTGKITVHVLPWDDVNQTAYFQ